MANFRARALACVQYAPRVLHFSAFHNFVSVMPVFLVTDADFSIPNGVFLAKSPRALVALEPLVLFMSRFGARNARISRGVATVEPGRA